MQVGALKPFRDQSTIYYFNFKKPVQEESEIKIT